MKGKQVLLTTEQELSEMYEKCKGRKSIMLWVKNIATTIQRKRLKSQDDEGPAPKASKLRYDGHLSKMSEVDTIVNQLETKHAEKYTPQQLRAWGHMLQMKKHTSFDSPPDKPFFRSRKHLKDSPKVT